MFFYSALEKYILERTKFTHKLYVDNKNSLVLLVVKTGVPGENHRPVASH
jgi:hypothetical protein